MMSPECINSLFGGFCCIFLIPRSKNIAQPIDKSRLVWYNPIKPIGNIGKIGKE